MHSELIQITTDEQGALVVSSLDFAQGLGINHKSLLETIRTHQEAIEQDFGLIAFESKKRGVGDSPFQTANLEEGKKNTKPFTVAYLTEDQALFVGTLSRNSKRVVEFKSTLVKSFAEARKRLQPAPSTTEQVLIQLISQSNQLLAAQQQQLLQLRDDVDRLQTSKARKSIPTLVVAPHYGRPRPVAPSMRQAVNQKVNEYCGWHGVEQSDTYNYLYKRLQQVYGISVWRFHRTSSESLLDAVERYGHLDKLYSLVTAELSYGPQE